MSESDKKLMRRYENLTPQQIYDMQLAINSFQKQYNNAHKGDNQYKNAALSYRALEDGSIEIEGTLVGHFQPRSGAKMPEGKYVIRGIINRPVETDKNGNVVYDNITEGNIGRTMHDQTTDEAYQTIIQAKTNVHDFTQCDCCGKNRRRDELYEVEKISDGENDKNAGKIYQVGSSCVKEVCKDGYLVDLISKLDNIADGHAQADRVHGHRGEKTIIDPKLYAKCVLAVNHFSLTDLGTVATFKKHKSGMTEYACSKFDINASKHNKSVLSKEDTDSPGENKRSTLSDWALYLYKNLYQDEHRCMAITHDAQDLELAIDVASDGKETLFSYLNDERVQKYVDKMYDAIDKNLSTIVDDKVQLYTDNLLTACVNFYAQTACETITKSISEYVNSHNDSSREDIGISNLEHDAITLRRDSCDTEMFMSGVGIGKTVNAKIYRDFVPRGCDTRNLIELLEGNHQITIKEHINMVSKNAICMPDVTFTNSGTLQPIGSVLVSHDGKSVLLSNGKVKTIDKKLLMDSELTYDKIKDYYRAEMCPPKPVDKNLIRPIVSNPTHNPVLPASSEVYVETENGVVIRSAANMMGGHSRGKISTSEKNNNKPANATSARTSVSKCNEDEVIIDNVVISKHKIVDTKNRRSTYKEKYCLKLHDDICDSNGNKLAAANSTYRLTSHFGLSIRNVNSSNGTCSIVCNKRNMLDVEYTDLNTNRVLRARLKAEDVANNSGGDSDEINKVVSDDSPTDKY